MNYYVSLHAITTMNIKRTILYTVFLLSATLAGRGQTQSTSVFNFLELPTSAHGMALGGQNVSLTDDDASLLMQNPALMSNVSDRSLNLSFLTYMRGCKSGSASWVMASGERGTWGVGVQFVGYGTLRETTVEGIEMGDFSALDMAISGGYSYTLTEYLAGGATGKFIYSHYGEFSSVALAVDLGLNAYNEQRDLSVSLVAANLGGQVHRFGDHHERLPFDLRAGITKRLESAPLQFTMTLTDLTRWRDSDFYSSKGTVGFGRKLTNHFAIGLDILPIEQLYISAGFNFRRAYEMKAAGSSHGAGLCFGAGVKLKRFKLDVAYAKYHVSAPSFLFNAQYTL